MPKRQHPEYESLRGSMAGLCAPLPTLRCRLRRRPRTARGRCGSLLLHRIGLAPTTRCRSPSALRKILDTTGFDDSTRVAVIRIAGQRPGVQHELATWCPGIGGDEASLHTELVRRAGLALADAVPLRNVEGVQLPAALALLLRADLIGAREWPGKCRLKVRVAYDLSRAGGNEPAEPSAQNAHGGSG